MLMYLLSSSVCAAVLFQVRIQGSLRNCIMRNLQWQWISKRRCMRPWFWYFVSVESSSISYRGCPARRVLNRGRGICFLILQDTLRKFCEVMIQSLLELHETGISRAASVIYLHVHLQSAKFFWVNSCIRIFQAVKKFERRSVGKIRARKCSWEPYSKRGVQEANHGYTDISRQLWRHHRPCWSESLAQPFCF